MKNRLKREKSLLSIGISWAILFQFAVLTAAAQAPPVVQSGAQPQGLPSELNIVVMEGEGAVIDVHQKLGHDPVVRIEDEGRKPIPGAVVVFTLPTEGATGEFATGGKSVTMTTDGQGQAAGKGLKINQVPGKLQVHITVSYKGLSARTNIVEFVEGPALHGTQGISSHKGKGKWIAIVILIGGGAAGGAVAAMSGKNSSSPSTVVTPPPTINPIGITPGTGTIAPPH